LRDAFARSLTVDADVIARTCLAMADRFGRGGKLIAFGAGAQAADAQHVSVEFVHPVIVGKRALPALSLTSDVTTLTGIAGREGPTEIFAHQMRLLADPADIALGISLDGHCPEVVRGLETAHRLGLLTVALVGGGGGELVRSRFVQHVLAIGSADPLLVKEAHVTTCHILWELVHVFLEYADVCGSAVSL
jgi:D-sedoheptulose 7-phosphate isomerase